jgi:type II secretory pathway component PulL
MCNLSLRSRRVVAACQDFTSSRMDQPMTTTLSHRSKISSLQGSMKSKMLWPLNKEFRRAFGCLILAFFVFFDKHGDLVANCTSKNV